MVTIVTAGYHGYSVSLVGASVPSTLHIRAPATLLLLLLLLLLLKRHGREADHSPPPSAETKNGRALPALPHTP
jgi:hypothetical protein